jgi:hypothetical protein
MGKKIRKRFFTPLSSKLLQRILGTRHARRILDNLMEWKVIESDNQYVSHEKSKSQRTHLELSSFCNPPAANTVLTLGLRSGEKIG